MHSFNVTDTIAAIATPIGEGGIGIVRISGKDAIAIAENIFQSKDGCKPSTYETYTVHYGWIVNRPQSTDYSPQRISIPWTVDRGPSTDIIDEVLLTVMRAPRSYTREDVAEINCHGGIVALRRVLELVLAHGARLADPGEFTRRAFLNGRIDLAQAEAVLDIIRAKTDAALKVGSAQLKGALSKIIRAIRNDLLEILAAIEASIDFPDEEIAVNDTASLRPRLQAVNKKLNGLIQQAAFGRILREGISVVICGKPNVGKSSLLNALLKQERSIVTSVAGTTRDTIEEIIDIKGIPMRIVDTAGIIEPKDLVERKAVQRAKMYIKQADVVLFVFDGSLRLSRQDYLLMKKVRGKLTLSIINKIDLPRKIEAGIIRKRFAHVIELSAKKLKNLPALEQALADLVHAGSVGAGESIAVSNLRHSTLLGKAEKLIEEAIVSLDNKLSVEFVAQGLKESLSCFDEIIGEKFSEELLGEIFGNFCVGK